MTESQKRFIEEVDLWTTGPDGIQRNDWGQTYEEFVQWVKDSCPYHEGWEKSRKELEAMWERLG
jgi:hypothetical protein